MVYILPFLSYLAGCKRDLAHPSDPDTMTITNLEDIASSSGKNGKKVADGIMGRFLSQAKVNHGIHQCDWLIINLLNLTRGTKNPANHKGNNEWQAISISNKIVHKAVALRKKI